MIGLLIVATSLCGCRRSEIDNVLVSGSVTYLGKPIDDGEIRFIPSGATKGPVSSALIANGHYQVNNRGGVPVGTYRVEIFAFHPKQGEAAVNARGAAPGEAPKDQYLPGEFNDQSQLTTTIEAGHASVTKDFSLEHK